MNTMLSSREAAKECSPQLALSLPKGRKPWGLNSKGAKPREGRKRSTPHGIGIHFAP
jgi:hypothetical protein